MYVKTGTNSRVKFRYVVVYERIINWLLNGALQFGQLNRSIKWKTDAIGQDCSWSPVAFGRENVCRPTRGISVSKLFHPYVRTLQRVTLARQIIGAAKLGRIADAHSGNCVSWLPAQTQRLTLKSSVSRPLFYAIAPKLILIDIRFFPLSWWVLHCFWRTEPVFSHKVNTPSCIIDYWREPDPNWR